MSEHRSFYRKIIYLVLIAVLLFPISQLGSPSTRDDQGGQLAQLRTKYELGQANLGDIDPSSETIRLATLGLRGIAVSLLWNKAIEYKKKEDFTNLRATLGQLSKLQPYFISFWRFQAWNLSYNVSVELDDVGDRYYYVKRGIEFLKEGIKYNRNSPYLLSDLGWFIGNKIGRADEKALYRKLFKQDDDFHPSDRPPELRDNWLVSKYWYQNAISAVDDLKKSMGGKNPTTFFDKTAMAQINYSTAIEREGVFGEKARNAWATAERLWLDFGNRSMRSSRGYMIQLASYERLQEEVKEIADSLEELVPQAREEILSNRRELMSKEMRDTLDLEDNEMSLEELELRAEARQELTLKNQDFVDYIAENLPDKSGEARKLINRIAEVKNRLYLVQTNRDVSNYSYWEKRCQFEQSSEAINGRRLAYAGRRAFQEADLLESQRLYEESFVLWEKVLDEFPEMIEDISTGADIVDYILEYRELLEQLDLTLNEEEIHGRFPLWEFLDINDSERKFSEELKLHKQQLQEK